jgi:hypothetical protein
VTAQPEHPLVLFSAAMSQASKSAMVLNQGDGMLLLLYRQGPTSTVRQMVIPMPETVQATDGGGGQAACPGPPHVCV